MKNRFIVSASSLLFPFAIIFVAFVAVQAKRQTELKVRRISPDTVRVSGADKFIYSPSGKYLAIQAGAEFTVVPARDISRLAEADDFLRVRRHRGEAIGFTPSEKLIHSIGEKLFALDPASEESLFQISQSKVKRALEKNNNRETLFVVSDQLVISGSGEEDWGGFPGYIYRYDLKRERVTRGPKIPQFSDPQLSPSGRFISYDHGESNSNNADIYDINRNRNYPLADYFNLKKAFPAFPKTNEFPMMWLEGRRQDKLLAVIETGLHPDDITPENEAEQNKRWLVLLDVPRRKILWKKLFAKNAYFVNYDQLDRRTLLVSYHDKGVYEISLVNGSERKHLKLDGQVLLSPDKKRVAFVRENRLFVSALDGGNKKLILPLPPPVVTTKSGYQSQWSPMWSTGGDALILHSEKEWVIAQL